MHPPLFSFDVIPMLILNIASGLVSIFYKLRGPNVATCSACSTAIPRFYQRMPGARSNASDADVRCWSAALKLPINPWGIGGFCAMKAMSTRNAEPCLRSSRPFDAGRDGFVMGEGAGVVMLEELEHARTRAPGICRGAHRVRQYRRRQPHYGPVARRRGSGPLHAQGAKIRGH